MLATGGSVSPGALYPVYDAPSDDGRGWVGTAYNADTTTSFSMLVSVVCTPGATATVAAVGSHGGASPDALKAAVREAHAE
jgi:hypothetical protein